jgi:hypothetical protein
MMAGYTTGAQRHIKLLLYVSFILYFTLQASIYSLSDNEKMTKEGQETAAGARDTLSPGYM